MGDGHQSRPRQDGFLHLRHVQPSIGMNADDDQAGAGLAREALPGKQVRRVLGQRDDDVVPGPDARGAPRGRDEVDPFRRPAREDHLVRRGRVDEPCDAGARCVDRDGRTPRERMQIV